MRRDPFIMNMDIGRSSVCGFLWILSIWFQGPFPQEKFKAAFQPSRMQFFSHFYVFWVFSSWNHGSEKHSLLGLTRISR